MLYDGKFHCFAFEPKFFLSLLCSYKNNMVLNFFNVLLFSQSSILASDLYNLLEACWPRYFWIFAPTSVITKGKALLQTGWIIRIFEEGNPPGSDNLGTHGPSETKPLDVYFLNLHVKPFAISPRISKSKVKPWCVVNWTFLSTFCMDWNRWMLDFVNDLFSIYYYCACFQGQGAPRTLFIKDP